MYKLKILLIIVSIGLILFISGLSIILNTFIKIDTANDCNKYKTFCWVAGGSDDCEYFYMENNKGVVSQRVVSQGVPCGNDFDENCPFNQFGNNITCYFKVINDYSQCPLVHCPRPAINGVTPLSIVCTLSFIGFIMFIVALCLIRSSIIESNRENEYFPKSRPPSYSSLFQNY